MKDPNTKIPSNSNWWPLPILALLRGFLKMVSRTENMEKLWRIFIVYSWSEAGDAERLKLEKDGTSWEEVYLYALVLRNLPALAAEQDRKVVRRLGTPTERKNFKVISAIANEILVRFNSRIQSYGLDCAQALPVEEQSACVEALVRLELLAKDCPKSKIRVKRPDLRDPIEKHLGMLDNGLAGLRDAGVAPLTGNVEKEVAILKVKIREAQGIPTIKKTPHLRDEAA